MTFGLQNAGATYQRAMNMIFHELLGNIVEVYINDIVVKSVEFDFHLADSRWSSEKMCQYGLKMTHTNMLLGVG